MRFGACDCVIDNTAWQPANAVPSEGTILPIGVMRIFIGVIHNDDESIPPVEDSDLDGYGSSGSGPATYAEVLMAGSAGNHGVNDGAGKALATDPGTSGLATLGDSQARDAATRLLQTPITANVDPDKAAEALEEARKLLQAEMDRLNEARLALDD